MHSSLENTIYKNHYHIFRKVKKIMQIFFKNVYIL